MNTHLKKDEDMNIQKAECIYIKKDECSNILIVKYKIIWKDAKQFL